MTETTETTDVPPLAKSITHALTDLAAHACAHGEQDATAGRSTPEEMPPCLASHVGSLATTLFGLTRPEEHECTISTAIEFPIDLAAPELPEGLPDGLVEELQQKLGAFLETLGKRS